MIPGMRQEFTLAESDDAVAVWSVAFAPEAARWVREGGDAPTFGESPGGVVGSQVPDAAYLAQLSFRFGRIPARWILPNAGPFERGFCAAVRDDGALVDWILPLLVAGLFGTPRDERRHALEATGAVRGRVRRGFESMRMLGRPSEATTGGAQVMLQAYCAASGPPRARASAMLAGTVGSAWVDELTVLAHGAWRGPLRFESMAEEVACAVAWWTGAAAWGESPGGAQ